MVDSALLREILEKKYLGKTVICRSNEDDPLMIGKMVALSPHGFPVVEDRETKKEWIVMGVVIPHMDEMEALLSPLTPKRQWEILAGISLTIQELKSAPKVFQAVDAE